MPAGPSESARPATILSPEGSSLREGGREKRSRRQPLSPPKEEKMRAELDGLVKGLVLIEVEPSLYTIKAIFILDSFGQRLLAKYYDDTFPSTKEQKSFERNVFNKTQKTDSEIAFLEGLTIVYKSSIDLFFYVVGSPHENELMLMSVLTCLFESLNHMLRKNVEKRTLVENMDGVFLVVDEIVDGGVILESDPQQVVQKLNFRVDDTALSEHTVTQAIFSRLILMT